MRDNERTSMNDLMWDRMGRIAHKPRRGDEFVALIGRVEVLDVQPSGHVEVRYSAFGQARKELYSSHDWREWVLAIRSRRWEPRHD